ncbi:hypothetical protein [Salinibacter ruber]|uniref:hypothetical protein n=1 Tax=Salinibacter ruber TaxID=146919 RepID=UPI000E58225A|nr:hypothetical protein [Salinibacter ruber]
MPASSSSDTRNEGRLMQAARAAASLAARLTTAAGALAGTSAGAGLLLWSLLWWPVGSHLASLVGAGGTFVLLLGPSAVLALFYLGLRDLRAFPDRLANRTARTVEHSADAAEAVASGPSGSGLFGRLWGIATQIWALRGVLLENRALLVRYGALIRFVNPGFLLLVVGAALATGLLVPGALLAVLVVGLV